VPASPSLLTGVLDDDSLARLFERSNGVKWGLSRDTFAEALGRSVASRFGTSGANVAQIQSYLETLYLEDLALACACAEGQVTAWAYFVECFRPALRAAARAIAGDDGGAEIADGLYAELYGLDERDGRRRSLFDYFHGRSRLATWLRAVIAQRHVDGVRRARRFDPLDETTDGPASPDRSRRDDPERERRATLAQATLARAIARLAPRERLRLSCYYLQRLTLAQIGRMFGEHEATVSRKLDRCRRELREQVGRMLRDDHKLGQDEVQACFEAATDDTPVDLERALTSGRQERTG
jgi:RNA polymerase sigma-70 factor (ECF subfamily)